MTNLTTYCSKCKACFTFKDVTEEDKIRVTERIKANGFVCSYCILKKSRNDLLEKEMASED